MKTRLLPIVIAASSGGRVTVTVDDAGNAALMKVRLSVLQEPVQN